MPGLAKYLFVAAAFFAAPAHAADWLEQAWSAESVARTGTPAITLGASAVLLVLPAATLAAAHAAGVSTPEAVRLFVGRYGQRCSAGLDLDRPHPHLRVQLLLQTPVALEDAGERVQGEILDALESAKTKPLPRVERLFAVTDAPAEVFIDYVPQRHARCVRPGDAVS
ncbi:MAG TPA: hypothetical protein VF930_06070 [Stellaceae bacterium]